MISAVMSSADSTMLDGVVFVLPELLPVPPVQGGAVEYWVDEVSRHLRRGGYKVAVLSRPAGSPLADEKISYLGVPWTALSSRLLRFKQTTSKRNPLRHLAKIQNVLSYGMKARALLPSASARIVYIHNDPSLALMLMKQPGQKFVLHMHNDHLLSRGMRPVYRKVLEKVDLVLCVSDYIRRGAVAVFPDMASKFRVVDNGTDAEFFKPVPMARARAELVAASGGMHFEDGCTYFLYVGRVAEIKGVHVLIDAFRKVLAQNPKARLVVTGSSFFGDAPKTAYEARVQQACAGIEHAIVFTGFLAHDKVRLLYCAADVVIVPSIWQEPAGLVLIESQACGACLIATRVGGSAELVSDEQTGILIEPNDAELLSAAMTRLMNDPALRARLGMASRQAVEDRFTWQQVSSNLDAIFRTL